jgi:hypothetical protein
MHRLQKWYFDFLTPDNDFVFVYLALVRLAGLRLRSLTVHLARPERDIVWTQAIPIPEPEQTLDRAGEPAFRWPGGEIKRAGACWRLDFSSSNCSVRLDFDLRTNIHLQPVVITPEKGGSILWKPLGLNYEVTGRVSLGAESVEVQRARGYADHLECTCPPWRIPVRCLYWGRLNHPAVALTYMRATNGCGDRSWSGVYGRAGDLSFQSGQVSIQVQEPGQGQPPVSANRYSLSANTNAGPVALAIGHQVPVQHGSFIDQQNTMSSLTRSLVRLLTRNPRSTKFLSRADLKLDFGEVRLHERNLPLVDEFVIL